MKACGKEDLNMAKANIDGKTELYFKVIFGWINDKDQVFYIIQTALECKVIGKIIKKFKNHCITNTHLQKLKLITDF